MEKSRRTILIIVFAAMAAGALIPALFFNKRPNSVVVKALRKLDGDIAFMGVATIGTFVPSSAVAVAGGDPSAMQLPIVFVGQGGMNLPKDKPPSGTATFMMVGQGTEGKDLTLDMRVIQDGKTYAKLLNLPSTEKSAALVKLVDDKWFAMDARTLGSLITRDPQQPSAEADNPTGTRPAATWQAFRKHIISPGFFGTPLPLALTEITAAPVKRYALPINHEKLVLFSQDLKSLMLGRSLSAEELKQVADDMAVRDVALEVWINTNDYEIEQLKLTVASFVDDDAVTDPHHFSMVIKFTSWGAPVEVSVPADVTQYADFMALFKKPTP